MKPAGCFLCFMANRPKGGSEMSGAVTMLSVLVDIHTVGEVVSTLCLVHKKMIDEVIRDSE